VQWWLEVVAGPDTSGRGILTAMEVSHRVNALQGSATLEVNARIRALKAQGVDVIGFGAGEPDFDTPDNIKQAAINALLAGQTRYTAVPGELAARETIARKLRDENNIACSAEDIVISVGGKHSLYLSLQCLIDPPATGQPAQQVIVPTPAWVSYMPMIQLAGGETVQVPGAVSNDFKITPQQLEQAITDRTVAVIINSPSNPCGTMYTPDDLHALADVLEKHPNVTIITDEIYEKLIYGEASHLSMGSIRSIADRVITVNGLSKAYAMTGWRIGYACAPGQGGIIAKAMGKLQSQMTSNITSFCYAAIEEALTNGSEMVETMRRAFTTRAGLIHDRISAMPQVVCPQPTGAFYVFPDISAYFGKISPGGNPINSAVDFATALLNETNVAVVPGEDFGDCARHHVRLSFACSEKNIEEGCARMDQWLRSIA